MSQPPQKPNSAAQAAAEKAATMTALTPEQINNYFAKEYGEPLSEIEIAIRDLALQAHTARRDALEEAARVCENEDEMQPLTDSERNTGRACAYAIRAIAAQDQRGAAAVGAENISVEGDPTVAAYPGAGQQSAPHPSSPPQVSTTDLRHPSGVAPISGPAAGGDFVPCHSCGSAWCKEHRQCLQGRAAGGGHGWITGTADVDAMNAAAEAALSSPPQAADTASNQQAKPESLRPEPAAGGDCLSTCNDYSCVRANKCMGMSGRAAHPDNTPTVDAAREGNNAKT